MKKVNKNLEFGMKHVLKYHELLSKNEELRNMCNTCEIFCGDEHDYNGCKDCQGFKFYCELRTHRFNDTFGEGGN